MVETLNWKTDPTEKQFYQGLEDAKKGIGQAEKDSEILEQKEFDIKNQYDQTQQFLTEQKNYITSLLQRKNRVPVEQIALREQLLKKLNIVERDLPFANICAGPAPPCAGVTAPINILATFALKLTQCDTPGCNLRM